MVVKNRKLLIVIYILYLILILFVGSHHEPWFDEAQSWLIARDNTYVDILRAIVNEGHPFLWYYILRTFYLIGFDYNLLYLVSVFFAAIGVYLFLFKTEFPTFIKAMVPFSFPIFYQHSIIARSYCLVFPVLMLYAISYRKYRYTNPFIIMGLLILLSAISLYTTALSFILLVLYVCDLFKNKKVTIKFFQSIPFLIYFYIFLYASLQLSERKITGIISYDFSAQLYEKFYSILKSFLFPLMDQVFLGVFLVFAILSILLYSFYKKVYLTIFFILGTFLYYYYFLYAKLDPWHIDLLLIYIIFFLVLSFKEEHKNILKNRVFYSVLSFILFVSCFHSLLVSYNDVKHPYDSSKVVADYIKKNNLLDKKIYAYSFKPFAIHPYFEENIFMNSERTWWEWRDAMSKGFILHNLQINKNVYSDFEIYKPDVIIYPIFIGNNKDLDFYLNQNNIKHKKECFDANMFYKSIIVESNGYCLILLDKE